VTHHDCPGNDGPRSTCVHNAALTLSHPFTQNHSVHMRVSSIKVIKSPAWPVFGSNDAFSLRNPSGMAVGLTGEGGGSFAFTRNGESCSCGAAIDEKMPPRSLSDDPRTPGPPSPTPPTPVRPW